MTDGRHIDCAICELPLGNSLRRYLDGVLAHEKRVRDLLRTVEGQKRLVKAGETYPSRRPPAYPPQSPGSYR